MSARGSLELARLVAEAAVAAGEALRLGDLEELAARLGVTEDNACRLVAMLEQEEGEES